MLRKEVRVGEELTPYDTLFPQCNRIDYDIRLSILGTREDISTYHIDGVTVRVCITELLSTFNIKKCVPQSFPLPYSSNITLFASDKRSLGGVEKRVLETLRTLKKQRSLSP